MAHNLQVLANLVWELRFLSMAAQTAHWRVFGPTSYSDHLLFGRIYEKLDSLLDPMAERLTAFSEFNDERYVDPVAQARYVFKRMKKLAPEMKEAFLDANLAATFFYEQLLRLTRKMRSLSSTLRTEGFLTYGLDDLLASTANEIETLVYFLERRSQQMAGPGLPPPGFQAPEPAPQPAALPPFPMLPMPPPALVLGPRG
jgi:DNA-binding ferritin-like protein